MTSAIDQALEIYRGNLGEMIDSIPGITGQKKASYVNAQLKERPELSVDRQRISNLRNPNKIQKGGLTLQSMLTFGLALYCPDDVQVAPAMVFLKLMGLWDEAEIPAEQMKALLKSRFKASVTVESDSKILKEIHSGVKLLTEVLTEEYELEIKQNPTVKFLADKIGDYTLEDVKKTASATFNEAASDRVIEVFEGKGEPMVAEDWGAICYVITTLTGNTITVEDLRHFTETVLAPESADAKTADAIA